MATWNIQNNGTTVVLTYDDGKETKHCGSGPVALERDLLGWVMDQAAPGDRITTQRGVFVRQPTPAGSN
jgi:hypothetical protein